MSRDASVPMIRLHPRAVRGVLDRLLTVHGEQGWWPADTPFEVIVGAVLTQNTAWTNVEQALENLRAANALVPEAIIALPEARLGELIRPSGYYNVKARRLQAVCRFVLDHGGIEALSERDTHDLRDALLAVHGVGHETADDIVLYGFHRCVFVIDAYTRRIFTRLGHIDGSEGYEELRAAFERALPEDVELYKEYHALLVQHAKTACRVKPGCEACCLRSRCAVGRDRKTPG